MLYVLSKTKADIHQSQFFQWCHFIISLAVIASPASKLGFCLFTCLFLPARVISLPCLSTGTYSTYALCFNKSNSLIEIPDFSKS